VDKAGNGRIVVLGDSSTAIGFRLAGAKLAYDAEGDAAARLQESMGDASVSIIVVSERLFEGLPKSLKHRAVESINPIVVTIPDKDGGKMETDTLKTLIKRAVGFDLLGE
jgi:vacuolar-type H+-ATPase subunit F/Vma7